jgi:hypothetical protein
MAQKMAALPLASKRMRTSFLLNISRSRTTCTLKGQYQKDNGLDGAKDGRTSASIQVHAHILPAEQKQESHNLRIKGVYHENNDIIGTKYGRTTASVQAHAHILPAEQQQESHNLLIKGVYHENYGIIGA